MSGVGGPGWDPPPPPPPSGWDAPQPWAQWPAPPPPPPPPKRPSTALVVGLGVGAAVLLLVVSILGLASRGDRLSQEPVANIDHWHAAYGVYLCDRFLAPVEGNGDSNGIHSHGDGVVHVEPLNRASAGSNAVFRRFEEAQRSKITSRSLEWVDGTAAVQADVADGCDGRPAEIASFVDALRVGSAPGGIRLRDGQVIVVALVPKGTSYEQIGPPPSLRDLPRIRGLIP